MNHIDPAEPLQRSHSGKRITRTHSALLRALLLLLEEKAFDQITVKEITGRAEVGYATFFRRYADKEELFHDLAAQEIQKLLTMTLPIFYVSDTLASTEALCAYVWKHRKLWRALLTGGAASMMKEEYLRQALRVAEKDFEQDAWLPVDLAVRFAVCAIVETLAWWLQQAAPPNVKAMAVIVNKLAVQPVFDSPE